MGAIESSGVLEERPVSIHTSVMESQLCTALRGLNWGPLVLPELRGPEVPKEVNRRVSPWGSCNVFRVFHGRTFDTGF